MLQLTELCLYYCYYVTSFTVAMFLLFLVLTVTGSDSPLNTVAEGRTPRLKLPKCNKEVLLKAVLLKRNKEVLLKAVTKA